MKEIVATVDSRGRAVIPAEVRRHLGIEPEDKTLFMLGEEGQVELKDIKYRTINSLRGAVGKLSQPLSWEEMRQIAREDRYESAHPSE